MKERGRKRKLLGEVDGKKESKIDGKKRRAKERIFSHDDEQRIKFDEKIISYQIQQQSNKSKSKVEKTIFSSSGVLSVFLLFFLFVLNVSFARRCDLCFHAHGCLR